MKTLGVISVIVLLYKHHF